ncbi:hypothetical protein GJ744_004097 [Endocarpon pusillum]|uniref:Uncharacterized protein n=1 Tax=Endocarpon pusillum TaxID=364733 RepID=A0A8H7E5S4_9EURO|nr:hypothetical protein GJ744_004097 [Endocarpon pusillum]
MAANRVVLAHQHLITPSPTPWMILGRQDGASSKMSFEYPKCRNDPSGPCELLTSTSKACQKAFDGSADFYKQKVCECTRGYYELSSQCWTDCYSKSNDPKASSRDSRLASLGCESYSLEMESHEAFYSSLSDMSVSRENTASEESASATIAGGSGLNTDGVLPGSITGAGASEGATAVGGVAPETMSFVDRPTATAGGQPRQEGGEVPPTVRVAKRNALWSVTAVLALMSVLHGLL